MIINGRASLVTQLVKNLSAMQETLVQFLGWEDPREKGMATHSRILAWRITHGQMSLKGYSPWGCKELDTYEQARGVGGIPLELFQIIKDDAMKVLHSGCQQIWKTQQWPQDWKRSVFIPIPKKGNAKECSNYRTIALILHASKVKLKILQTGLQQYVNCELPGAQAGFWKGRGTRD